MTTFYYLIYSPHSETLGITNKVITKYPTNTHCFICGEKLPPFGLNLYNPRYFYFACKKHQTPEQWANNTYKQIIKGNFNKILKRLRRKFKIRL